MKIKKSRAFSLRSVINRVTLMFTVFGYDRISVYAAQASFFIVISAIPFVMLLFSLSSFILPEKIYDIVIAFCNTLPEQVKTLSIGIVNEIYNKPALELISISAFAAFFTSSRGVNSVREGISTVYKSTKRRNFLSAILMSLFYTGAFIIMIIALLLLLLFGSQLGKLLSQKLPIFASFEGIFEYRSIILFAGMALFFSFLYYTVGRKSHLFGKKFICHVPGALIAAAGWSLFSYVYSLYTLVFPSASYIYGSLGAIVLLMLWLYMCMNILLIGAEINKFFAFSKKKKNAVVPENDNIS